MSILLSIVRGVLWIYFTQRNVKFEIFVTGDQKRNLTLGFGLNPGSSSNRVHVIIKRTLHKPFINTILIYDTIREVILWYYYTCELCNYSLWYYVGYVPLPVPYRKFSATMTVLSVICTNLLGCERLENVFT